MTFYAISCILLKNIILLRRYMYEAIFCIIWIVAGFISGVSGLGAAMFAVPFVAVFIEPHMLIPISTCLVTFLCLEIGLIYRKDLLWTELRKLLLGALPGLLLGTYILVIIPTSLLLMAIGIVMICFVLWQFLHKVPEKAGTSSLMTTLGVGFIAGILATAVSFGGPPCAVYSLHMGWTQKQTLSTLNIWGGLASLIGLGTYYFSGLINHDVLYWAMLGIPAVSAGIFLAVPVNRFINIRVFRIILLIVIGIGGLSCIVKSFL